MKAIVIDEPWIGLILAGEKTWEMRRGSCSHRGPVALIRKGSGLVVGTANVVDSLAPLLTPEAYGAAERHHRIPPARQGRAREDGWATPWVLADARPLDRPVPYRHPYGAVIWVNLEPEVAAAIAGQLGISDFAATTPTPRPEASLAPTVPSPPARKAMASPALTGETRVVTITGGNLRNNHIYLPLEFFPAETIGGRNKHEAAPREISVTFEPGGVVQADIDGTKRILRSRPPIGDFFARAGIAEGDKVVIRRHNPYAYSVSKLNAG